MTAVMKSPRIGAPFVGRGILAGGNQTRRQLVHVVGLTDLGIRIPPHGQRIERIEHDIAPISTIEALLIAGVRVREHHTIAARQCTGKQLTNRGRFSGTGRSYHLEVLGLIQKGNPNAGQSDPVRTAGRRSPFLAEIRLPSMSTTPRLCESRDGFRSNRERNPTAKISATTMNNIGVPIQGPSVAGAMASVPLGDVIVGLLAVDRRLAIDAHAEARGIAATFPLDPASALFQTGDAFRQRVALHS